MRLFRSHQGWRRLHRDKKLEKKTTSKKNCKVSGLWCTSLRAEISNMNSLGSPPSICFCFSKLRFKPLSHFKSVKLTLKWSVAVLTVVLQDFFPLSLNPWHIQMWNPFEPDRNLNWSTMEWTKTIFNADSGNRSQMTAAQQKEKTFFFFFELIKYCFSYRSFVFTWEYFIYFIYLQLHLLSCVSSRHLPRS